VGLYNANARINGKFLDLALIRTLLLLVPEDKETEGISNYLDRWTEDMDTLQDKVQGMIATGEQVNEAGPSNTVGEEEAEDAGPSNPNVEKEKDDGEEDTDDED